MLKIISSNYLGKSKITTNTSFWRTILTFSLPSLVLRHIFWKFTPVVDFVYLNANLDFHLDFKELCVGLFKESKWHHLWKWLENSSWTAVEACKSSHAQKTNFFLTSQISSFTLNLSHQGFELKFKIFLILFLFKRQLHPFNR